MLKAWSKKLVIAVGYGEVAGQPVFWLEDWSLEAGVIAGRLPSRSLSSTSLPHQEKWSE